MLCSAISNIVISLREETSLVYGWSHWTLQHDYRTDDSSCYESTIPLSKIRLGLESLMGLLCGSVVVTWVKLRDSSRLIHHVYKHPFKPPYVGVCSKSRGWWRATAMRHEEFNGIPKSTDNSKECYISEPNQRSDLYWGRRRVQRKGWKTIDYITVFPSPKWDYKNNNMALIGESAY